MQCKVPLQFRAACLVLPILALAGCDPVTESTLRLDESSVQTSRGRYQMTAEFERQLSELRRATARFHNIGAAADADYDAMLTPCWYYSGQGAMGYHFGNLGLIDESPELLAPEILAYEPMRNGGLRLVALEYIVPIAAWQGATPPSLLGQEFHRNDVLGLYALHVWLWRHNPRGMFADWNPTASCEYAAESEDRAP